MTEVPQPEEEEIIVLLASLRTDIEKGLTNNLADELWQRMRPETRTQQVELDGTVQRHVDRIERAAARWNLRKMMACFVTRQGRVDLVTYNYGLRALGLPLSPNDKESQPCEG